MANASRLLGRGKEKSYGALWDGNNRQRIRGWEIKRKRVSHTAFASLDGRGLNRKPLNDWGFELVGKVPTRTVVPFLELGADINDVFSGIRLL